MKNWWILNSEVTNYSPWHPRRPWKLWNSIKTDIWSILCRFVEVILCQQECRAWYDSCVLCTHIGGDNNDATLLTTSTSGHQITKTYYTTPWCTDLFITTCTILVLAVSNKSKLVQLLWQNTWRDIEPKVIFTTTRSRSFVPLDGSIVLKIIIDCLRMSPAIWLCGCEDVEDLTFFWMWGGGQWKFFCLTCF